ncbi:MAG: response regulator [Crocosphaera sp.]|nr:response regulator [Crocosphaera sp.]
MNSSTNKPEAPVILIVDDDRTMRSLLKIAMEEEGYRVTEAKNGLECLESYNSAPPNLILLDALMPDMDGFACCKQLSSLQDNSYIPILMITALDDQASIERAFEVGATDYITKPIFWSVLSQRVKHLLSSTQNFRDLNYLKSRLAKQEQWQQFRYALIRQCQEDFHLQPLLNDCISQLRTLVNAERVGIHHSNGKLMAESISSGYPSVKTISWQKITLFTVYQGRYEKGESMIIDFSQETELSDETVAPFQQLMVKTLTIIPLLIKGEFWGILWIHHCQNSYPWEPWEVEYLERLRELLVVPSVIIDAANVT